jgi:hypothetical protein
MAACTSSAAERSTTRIFNVEIAGLAPAGVIMSECIALPAKSAEVEISDDEARQLIRASDAAYEDEDNPRLTRSQRLYYAVPMFLASLLFGVMIHVCALYHETYKEAGIEGGLPLLTAIFVDGSAFVVSHPWTLPIGLFLIEWLYFQVIARRKRQVIAFNVVICVASLAIIWVTPVALLMPYVGGMSQIEK